MFLGYGFAFDSVHRHELVNCLSAAGIAQAAIPEIEQAVDTFRVLLASRGPTRDTADRLRRLAEPSERFVGELAGLDDDGRDLLREAIMRDGYSSAFLSQLAEGHRILERALAMLERERGDRIAKPGRPGARARGWLLRELHEILTNHHRPSRRKVLEVLARHGLKASPKAQDLPLAECARIVLRAVGQPVPAALTRITRRVRNLPRNR